MKTKLLLLSVCILTAMCIFAQTETKRPFERKSFCESEMNADLFLFREHEMHEMKNNRTPISTRQSNTATHRLDSVVVRDMFETLRWKFEFEYDDNGNIIVEFWYDDFRGNEKREFTLDSNGNMIMEVVYIWTNNAWRESEKTEHTFDSNGNNTLDIVSNWINDAWVESIKRERTFDSNGNNIVQIDFRWENNAWRENIKAERTFDSNRNQTMLIWYRWENNAWVKTSKTESTLNSNGNQTMQISYDWANNTWIEFLKTEHTLDSNGNTTMAIISRWQNNAWREFQKAENVFDLSVSISDVFRPNFFRRGFIGSNLQKFNKMIRETGYIWLNNAWGSPLTKTFYYSETPTNIPNISENSFTIFPNPALDNFTISGITENTLVKITDLNGRTVLQKTVAPNEQISVGHLSAGLYFVRVNGEVVKIVKQ